jgi:hypothetical protein
MERGGRAIISQGWGSSDRGDTHLNYMIDIALTTEFLSLTPPECHGCGPSLLDFGQGEAVPVTEVGFTEIVIDDCGQAQLGSRNGGGVDSTLQRGSDHGVDRGTSRQATGGGLGLSGSAGAEREVTLSAEAVFG